MDVLSLKDMVAREAELVDYGMTTAALMDAAGEAMAHRIAALYPDAQKFLVLVGKGHNGGDGLVVARLLAESGRLVQVVLAVPEDQLGELPRTRLDLLQSSFPDLEIIPWQSDLDFPGSDGVVIDALLGLQARGPLREPMVGIVAALNAARTDHFFRTVAIDLPSGLAAYEEGEAPLERDAAVIADVTLSIGFAKEVLCRESLSGWVGHIEVVPWSPSEPPSMPRQVLVAHELARLLPRRSALSFKGNFGRLAIVAGSPGFTGAAVLCAQAALAMGTGLLSIVTRSDATALVAATAPPETMVSGWSDSGSDVVEQASAIVIGPGLGVNEKTVSIIRAVLAVGCPVLIDADALTVLATNMNLLHRAKGPVLLTPHPGEMSRLAGRKFTPDDRETVAREFTDKNNVTLVLKGTRTLVMARGGKIFINTTGNPGLSTGGSGDTLCGILGALLAQGLDPLDAARLGVWLHGHAADLLLAERGCEEGITPTMVSAHLGAALVSLRTQAAAPAGLLERAVSFL